MSHLPLTIIGVVAASMLASPLMGKELLLLVMAKRSLVGSGGKYVSISSILDNVNRVIYIYTGLVHTVSKKEPLRLNLLRRNCQHWHLQLKNKMRHFLLIL